MISRICVIGNFSGRNIGDAAILGGILKDLTALFGRLKFLIPTIKPSFIRRQYGAYDVAPVDLRPWNLSLKIFGLPIFFAVARCDMVLVTDAILFDYQLLNPMFNYLSTMALALPLAHARGKPVILYNVSLGPVRTRLGRWCMRRVLESADEIVLRDRESLKVIDPYWNIRAPISSGADSALSTGAVEAARLDEILAAENIATDGKPYVTFNVNSYIDVFVRNKGERADLTEFVAMYAAAVNRVMARINATGVFVITQPMDTDITMAVVKRLDCPDRIRVVSQAKYSYPELSGIFSRAAIHTGMRTHSLILASSHCTPVVGIIATPKNRGYMQSIRQDARMIEFEDLDVDSLAERIVETWHNRQAIRAELEPIIAEQKAKSAATARVLLPYLRQGTGTPSVAHPGTRLDVSDRPVKPGHGPVTSHEPHGRVNRR